MENLLQQFSMGLVFWQTIIFLILLFLLMKFAWKPILNAVNEREEGIKDALQSAERAKEEMTNLKADNEKIINEAKIERDSLLKEAREVKDKLISDAKEQATTEANKIVANAKSSIQSEKIAAMNEIKNQIASLSIEIAEKILSKTLDDNKSQKELLDKLLDEIELN